MATTNFSNGTVITSDWLNDVDDFVYNNVLSGLDPTGQTSVYLHIDSGGAFEFLDADAVLADLLSSGSLLADQVILGYDGELSISVNGTTEVHEFAVYDDETAANNEFVVVHTNATAADAGVAMFARGRGVIGTPTVVSDDDVLGQIKSVGFDGTDYATATMIQFEVDGTPASDQMGGAIVFMTSPDGSQTVAEVLRLDQAKLATFAGGVTMTAGDLTLTAGDQTIQAGDLIFNTGAQSGGPQYIYARDPGGGGGALEKVMRPRHTNDRLSLFGGAGGFELKSSDDVTYWIAMTGTGAATWKSGVTQTIPIVDINGGDIDGTDIGQTSGVATGSFDDLTIQVADAPSLMYYDTGGASDEKYWQLYANSSQTFVLSAWNDALNDENAAIQVERSGNTIGDMTIGSPTLIGTDFTFDTGSGGSGSTIGAPTGGQQGAGTLNAEALYVNGVAVGSTGLTYDVKASDQTFPDTTITNDNTFASIALSTGKTYLIRVCGRIGFQSASSGLKADLSFSQTPQLAEGHVNINNAGTWYQAKSTDVTAGAMDTGTVGGTISGVWIETVYRIQANATTGGTVTLRWASSNTGDTYLYAGMAFEMIQLD